MSHHQLSHAGQNLWVAFSQSVSQFSRSVVSNCLQPHESQHSRPPCPSPTPGVYPNPCPSSRWCHPAISSSVIPFSSCPQSLPASGFFPTSQLFAWGGQSIGVSASVSVLPMNTWDWSPLGWTGWISLQSSGETLEYPIYLRCMLCSVSHVWLFVTPWTVAHQAPLSMGFSGKNPGVHNHFLLQRIFPTQGMNLCLPYLLHCRRILYCQATGEAHPNICSSKSVITS